MSKGAANVNREVVMRIIKVFYKHCSQNMVTFQWISNTMTPVNTNLG